LIEPMRISAGFDPPALSIQKQASDDRSSCLENPRPEGAESSLTENVTSPFQAEPAHLRHPSQPSLSLTSCQLIYTAITAGTSRVASDPLLPACRRQYPGRSDGN